MLFCYELFEYIIDLVFQPVQLRFESSVFKHIEYDGIGIFDRVFSSVCYQFVKYGISVKIEENKEIIVDAGGWYE